MSINERFLSLSREELDSVKKAIDLCIGGCSGGGKEGACPECASLEQVRGKINLIKF